MINVSVTLSFAAGHRILGLSGAGAKCRNIHGHNFRATWLYLQEPEWPPRVEFGELKRVLKNLVHERYDHTFFVDRADDFATYLFSNLLQHVRMDGPPTTEAMAELIARESMEKLPDLRLSALRLEEGPENTAVWSNPELGKWTADDMGPALQAKMLEALEDFGKEHNLL